MGAALRHAMHGARARGPRRTRGFALMDAIIAGILLAIGMIAVLGVSGHALTMQRRGEIDIRAAAALDELMSLVLTEGPVDFEDLHPSSGRFDADSPYADFEYEISIAQGGSGVPAHVSVSLVHDSGRTYALETRIAEKRGEEPDPVREPYEPLDREGRWEERRAQREGETSDEP
jgi:hypothetical protein